MAPVDGIRAPKRAPKRQNEDKNASPAGRTDERSPRKKTARQTIPVSATKTNRRSIPTERIPARPMKEIVPPKEELLLPSGEFDIKKRKRLMWILVICTALAIFLAWLLLFPGPRSSSKPNDYWASVGQKLSNLWSTVKTDILRIRENTANINTNSDEHIQQLENRVFPQFNDPTKQ